MFITCYVRLRQEEADRQYQANQTPHHHHVEENEEGEEEGEDEVPQGDVTKDLATDESIIDPVEERRTLAERNERLHDQLKVNILFQFYLIFSLFGFSLFFNQRCNFIQLKLLLLTLYFIKSGNTFMIFDAHFTRNICTGMLSLTGIEARSRPVA